MTAFAYACEIKRPPNADTLQNQLDAATAYHRQHEARLGEPLVQIEDRFEDRKQPLFDRPGAQQLRKLKPGDHVIATELGVLFWKIKPGLETIEDWLAGGVTLHIMGYRGQLLEFAPEFQEHIVGAFKLYFSMQSKQISEPTKEALAKRKAVEKRWCNNAPLGFQWSRDGRLEPDLHDQNIMAQLLEWRESGATYDELYFRLLRLRIKTSTGREWYWRRVHQAVQVARKLRDKGELIAIS